ncbi:MAG: hypothetical protein HY293_22160 [Planctomycetes bacterium]|nr:hypothetical protein [Planctomycetota bacterium]
MATRDFDRLPARRQFEVLEKIARQLRRSARTWGARYIGVGRRHRREKLHDEWCIKIFVRKKLAKPPPGRLIPRTIVRRVRVGGKRVSLRVPTDVVVAARAVRLQAGPCASLYNGKTKEEQGAATALVEGDATGRSFVLSAAHVVARNLEVSTPLPGELVFLTGDVPLGSLSYAPRMEERPMDAGLVELAAVPGPTYLQRTAPVTELCPESELLGHAMDSYSILSWRSIKSMTFVTWLYDFPVENVYAAGTVVFPKLLQFQGPVKGGDSGALVVDGQNRALGMHILGIQDEKVSYCLPMATLLAKLHPDEALTLKG